jgi:formate dehydrogenase maturation protein FdhE
MPDMLAIAQGLNALKATADIIKAMVGLRDAAQILEKTIELNQKILTVQTALADAQTEQTSLIQTVRELEEEIARLKAWNADKDRYQLEQLPPRVYVYALKQDMAREGEPVHSICPTCYQRDKKSVLQAGETSHGTHELTCHECGTKLTVGHFQAPPTRTRRP